jgi:hypothetical protein
MVKIVKKSKDGVVRAGKLRRSQFITGSGTGAIVDLAKGSAVMASIDFWKHHEVEDYQIYEENLQSYLGVDYFVTPAPDSKTVGQSPFYLPAFRFPDWMFCPECRRLAHLNRFSSRSNPPRCPGCKRDLVPSRFVVACKKGHLDDFPYEWWIHEGQGKQRCNRPELYFFTNEKSPGLESIVIWCKTCSVRRSMAMSFNENALKGMTCTGRRPWNNDYVQCEETMRTLQRGATNLYFPIIASALSVPPWSEQIQQELSKHWYTLSTFVEDEDLFNRGIERFGLPAKLQCSAKELYKHARMKKNAMENPKRKSWQEILEDEYRALCSGNNEKGEFKTETAEVAPFLSKYVDSVVLVKKLREVVALKGFTRISPEYSLTDDDSFQPVGIRQKNWLPGVELKGEGIFIRFREEVIKEWEQKYEGRFKVLQKRRGEARFILNRDNLSPRYVLLHTLSHLLIRQLTLQCGYSSAAIKERIYSSFPSDDEQPALDMAGILLYTASNDSEGSLGGLVSQGETERLENTFRAMLENASWCSSDPLCIHSDGQGVNSLNYAACHSCTLLPETSCEYRNVFLDRAAVVGLLEEPEMGLFHEILAVEES